jgi:ferritin-like metal-binding protein YciE
VGDLKDQLTKHIDEAIAMEQDVLRMLDSMIETTDDDEIKGELREHKLETERQSERLRERLEAHGSQPSLVREAGGVMGALMKSVVDVARTEKAGRNARDGYATEHMEIASYQLLERIALRAGDEQTAQVARQNREEEEAMAKRLEAHWDRFADLSLADAGVAAQDASMRKKERAGRRGRPAPPSGNSGSAAAKRSRNIVPRPVAADRRSRGSTQR